MTHHSECSAHCGPGVRNVTKQCEQESLQQPSVNVPVDDRHCRHLNDLPPEAEPCTGTCNLAHWQFHPWSQVLFSPIQQSVFMEQLINSDPIRLQCSQTCGGGIQTRKAHCVDLNGRVIQDGHCPADEKILRQSCHVESCPRWEVGEWTPVNLLIALDNQT